jgi:predicted enzyme related to lactoylglutathione lyase
MSKLHGSWIWYELMAKDAHVAKAFYEAVVGWAITLDAVPTADPDTSYALIANADGDDGRHADHHRRDGGAGRAQRLAGLYRGG